MAFFNQFDGLKFSPLGSACGLAPAAPEATHRCIWQPADSTTRWSSGSSRPRRTWMRRALWAVASDEDWGGNDLMKHGIVVSKWLKCWWFKCFVEIVCTFDGTFVCRVYVFCTEAKLFDAFCIVDFRFAVFCSDHFNPKLITHFQRCSIDPDILTLTSPIVRNV